ncbi:MAG TPA: hypothetical protein DD400_00275 [Rhodospirillaceae bacterium]|nr:hypothetical protein [Rhodospirillaceae bacterium]
MEAIVEIIKTLKGLSEAFSWPIVVLISFLVFRAPIKAYINRITFAYHGKTAVHSPLDKQQVPTDMTASINKLGKMPERPVEVETNTNELEKVEVQKESGADAYLKSFDNPLLKDVEDRISEDLSARNIVDPSDKTEVLVRALASTQLALLTERIYTSIWGSQVRVLRFLNGQENGVDISALRPFYEVAKSDYPDWYKEQSFERWLGFLTSYNLITVEKTRYVITVAGRQFLRYIAEAGKPERLYG